MSVSLEQYLILSAILFSIGLYGALAKRNAIVILMSIELMLNGHQYYYRISLSQRPIKPDREEHD